MCKTVWGNIRHSFSELDTLLAWLAIFLWLSDYTWRFTGLDGFLNTLLHRLLPWDWENWRPIVGGEWYMIAASGVYWFGIIIVFIVFILLVRKIFTKRKDDTVEVFERLISVLERIEKRLNDNDKL